MKPFMLLPCIMFVFNFSPLARAEDFYPNFALVVHLPSYEPFLTNLGDVPIRVDGYAILSASGSLRVAGWAALDSAGPQIVAARRSRGGRVRDSQPGPNVSMAELNPLSSATWQSGQSWSIGFPFDTAAPDFFFDAVFKFASPDGLVLTGGTVVPPSQLARAALLAVREPSSLLLMLIAARAVVLVCAGSLEKRAATYCRHDRLPGHDRYGTSRHDRNRLCRQSRQCQ